MSKAHTKKEGIEIEVTKVEIEPTREDMEKVSKVRFKTAKGRDITYNPKVKKEEYRNGMAIQKVEQAKINDLPEVIRTIGETIRDKQKAKVIATFIEWKPEDKDDTYWFAQGKNMMEDWKLLKEETTEEKVE